MKTLIDKMVDKFLGWRLPDDFCPDGGIRFDGGKVQSQHNWPIGTNLLTASQAKTMFEACIEPIPMILHCPDCGAQHIDKSERAGMMHAPICNISCGMASQGCSCGFEKLWANPPHRSHRCENCLCIWRPCDLPTTGVAKIETRGKDDTWTPS